jgi:hypothetical protein
MNGTALAWLALTFTFASTALAQGGSQAVTSVGAVPVFVFAGQSNAVGVNNISELMPAQLAAQPNVLYYGSNETGNTWSALTPSSDSPNVGGSFGSEISTGLTISNALGGALVAEVKYAVGATNLYDQWNPAGVSNLYDNLVARDEPDEPHRVGAGGLRQPEAAVRVRPDPRLRPSRLHRRPCPAAGRSRRRREHGVHPYRRPAP